MHMRRQLPGTANDPLRLSRRVPELLERLKIRISLHAPDVLVISGDLLDVPSSVLAGVSPDDRSLSEWESDINSDLNFIKEWLIGCGIPYVVVPGNNDDETSFAQIFGKPSTPLDIAGLRFFCFWDKLSSAQQPYRNETDTKYFDSAILDIEHDCPQVHVHHYMIHPPIFAKNKHYQYTNADYLRKLIEESGRVLAVLSGHYHPGTLAEGTILHSGAPAFCEKPFSYRVYDLSSKLSAKVETFTLNQ